MECTRQLDGIEKKFGYVSPRWNTKDEMDRSMKEYGNM